MIPRTVLLLPVVGLALVGAVSPSTASATCIPAEIAEGLEGDFEICPEVEEDACPCFSTTDIDLAFDGLDAYAYSWNRRPWGVTDQTSLRADAWECGPDGWSAPTAGFDTYAETAECGTFSTYYCETWTDTWLAAPYHTWAGDGESLVVEVSQAEFEACEAVLDDYIAAEGVPAWSW